MNDVYTVAWVLFLSLAGITFGIIELLSLLDKRKGDTLSEHTRYWLGLHKPGIRRVLNATFFAAIIMGFAAWFVVHILWE